MARFRAPSLDSDDEDYSSSAVGDLSEAEKDVQPTRGKFPLQLRDQEVSSEQGSSEESEDDEDDEDEDESRPADRGNQTSIVPWAREVGVDPQRMHVMQTTLFRMPEEAAVIKEITQPEPAPRKKLLKSALARKHSRDSEGEGLRGESRPRASFAHDIEPPPYRPTRKYARVEGSASIVRGHEGSLRDAGLALGRSFRVSWGPGGTLLHLGSLCGPKDKPRQTANTSIVNLSTVRIFSTADSEASERTSKLLSHHLSHSPIEPDADGIPFADPSPALSFASFVSLFSANDRSFEASLFRLGHALFDPIELSLPRSLSDDIRDKISTLRRRRALSDWLQSAVAHSVDADLRNVPVDDWAGTVFTYLSGNQLEKACELAISSGNVKLATLLSQIPGDEEFRTDLREQLRLWREEKIDSHIGENTRKVYALLAGVVDVLEGSKGMGPERCPDLSLAAGLDWKRAFGLHLWFGQRMDTPISDAYESYNHAKDDRTTNTSAPIPWYKETASFDPSSLFWKLPNDTQAPDALYSLIRLFSEPETTLSDILIPQSFSSSPVDYRLPWHLYIILSRCLRIRDFADRGEPVVGSGSDDDDLVEGNSPSADLLANSYAMQLERLGLIQEAVFVLLHIEGPAGRKRAIKDLLSRNAAKLDDWMERGLRGSLKIPRTWVNEAKATYALSQGDFYKAYELYLDAEMYEDAHDIAVLKLAPEVVIRQDLGLLQELFDRMAGHPIDGWYVRGKLFLDYVHAMKRLPKLREQLDETDAMLEATQATELEELTRNVPKLISLLPDVLPDRSNLFYKAALSEMIAGLTSRLDQVRPLAIDKELRHSLVPETVRLRHVHAVAYENFLRTIEVA